jgi:hypothetical protein|tara:strand:+ start:22527 stop:23126 length:600 start_codon:yes stop_codon:yes gene_type:complete
MTTGQLNNDEIGSEPDVNNVVKTRQESVKIEMGPTQITSTAIGHVWIAGSSTNAIVGTWTGTQDSSQLVVGPTGAGTATVVQVINQNNTFIERFNFTTFKDATTTATWTGTGSITLTSAEFGLSTTAFTDGSTNITNAKMEIDDDTNLTLALSSDGGSNFETVTDGVLHNFTNVGTDLRWKITASGNATVTLIKVIYNI